MKFSMIVGHGNIERETEKAILFGFDDGSVWLPKSQIELDLPEEVWIPGLLTMPFWLAKDKFGMTGVWAMRNTGNAWLIEE